MRVYDSHFGTIAPYLSEHCLFEPRLSHSIPFMGGSPMRCEGEKGRWLVFGHVLSLEERLYKYIRSFLRPL
jgi:hypothetical protein